MDYTEKEERGHRKTNRAVLEITEEIDLGAAQTVQVFHVGASTKNNAGLLDLYLL